MLPLQLPKYNYQGFLNLPAAMSKYKPLINLWEESNQSEGYLHYKKPAVKDIFKKIGIQTFIYNC